MMPITISAVGENRIRAYTFQYALRITDLSQDRLFPQNVIPTAISTSMNKKLDAYIETESLELLLCWNPRGWN